MLSTLLFWLCYHHETRQVPIESERRRGGKTMCRVPIDHTMTCQTWVAQCIGATTQQSQDSSYNRDVYRSSLSVVVYTLALPIVIATRNIPRGRDCNTNFVSQEVLSTGCTPSVWRAFEILSIFKHSLIGQSPSPYSAVCF
ncbi:hypothetical protein BDZ89DRAFT_360851 [Hymenopellis radicata]|nr:hypothetical protein BDZ89DRAFT_360851 [Hymenopellis radicata]